MSDLATATPEMDEPTPVVAAPEPKTLDSVLDEVDAEIAAERTPSTVGTDRGDGRDVSGKWVKKNADGSPAPEPPSVAAAPALTPEGAIPPAPSLVSGAFKYRAVGATHEFPGATIDDKGAVTIAPESVGAFRAALNAKHLAEGEYVPLIGQYKDKIATLERQIHDGTAAEAKANALTDALSSALQHDDEVKALEAFYQLRATMPSLMAKAEADYWRQKASAPRTTAPSAPATAEAPSQPTLPTPQAAMQATTEYLERCKVECPEFRDVTPEDWKQLDVSLARTPYAFLRRATDEEVTAGSFAKDEVVYDTDQLIAYVTAETSKARQARETAKTQTKLAADNARRTTPQVTAPPSTTGTKAPAKSTARITSKQDLDDYWDSPEA